jgi:predicted MFS family arabinose efflux permease
VISAATNNQHRLRVSLAAVTALTMAVGTVAGPSLGILASVLIDEFDITRAEVGRLAAIYALVGAFAAPMTGRVADKIGGRQTMVLTALAGSVTFVAFAAARSYTGLMVMAFISGFPNGASNQGTNRMIASLIPAKERGTVTGVKQSGVQFGRFASGVALPPLVIAIGLRPSLLVVAVFGVFAAAIIPILLPNEPEIETKVKTATSAKLPGAVWWLSGYAFLLGSGAGATFAFNALYAEERLGFTNQQAGLLVGLTGLVAAASRIGFSRLTQASTNFAVPLGRIAVGAAISLVAVAAAPRLGAWALWVGVSAAAATLGSWNSVAMLATMASTPLDQAGRAAGRVMFGFLGGLGVVPPVFGAVVDRYDAYEEAWLSLAVLALAAAVVMLFWHRTPGSEGAAP